MRLLIRCRSRRLGGRGRCPKPTHRDARMVIMKDILLGKVIELRKTPAIARTA